MTDDLVRRPEFDQFRGDVTRRLDGHDSLYSDLRQTREELVAFTETLKTAREQIVSMTGDRAKCQEDCKGHRERLDARLKALERFRWQIGGTVAFLACILGPAIGIILKYS